MTNVLSILLVGVLLGWFIEWVYVKFMRIDPAESLKSELATYKKSSPALREKVRQLQDSDKALTDENAALKAQVKDLEAQLEQANIAEPEPEPEPEPEAPQASQAAAPKADGKEDLTRINGIGPKLAKALAAAGITEYQQLANLSLDQLVETLAPSEIRFSNDAAKTWLAQAEFAAKGDWDGLEAYKASLR